MAIKIFRTTYSDLSKQYAVLALSLLFFHVDYRHLSEGLPLNYFITAILVDKVPPVTLYDTFSRWSPTVVRPLPEDLLHIHLHPTLAGRVELAFPHIHTALPSTS